MPHRGGCLGATVDIINIFLCCDVLSGTFVVHISIHRYTGCNQAMMHGWEAVQQAAACCTAINKAVQQYMWGVGGERAPMFHKQ